MAIPLAFLPYSVRRLAVFAMPKAVSVDRMFKFLTMNSLRI